MAVLRAGFIGAALLSCLLTTSSPASGQSASCSANHPRNCIWPGAEVEAPKPRLLEIDLQDRPAWATHIQAATATRIQQAIEQLAFVDVGARKVVLTELVIRNGRILGPLLLEDLVVPFGLRFENVSIPAVDLRNVEFRGRLTFSNVHWFRKFYASKSEFQQGLEFRNDTSFEQHDRLGDTALRIDKSVIQRDMLISHTDLFADFTLYNNKIHPALRIEASYFNRSVKIRDNEFGNLDIYNTLLNRELELFSNDIERLELKDVYVFDRVSIDQNVLHDYVTIDSIVLMPKHGPEAQIMFSNNDISKELRFSADYLSSRVNQIELVGNVVRGRARLEFPSLWLDWGSKTPPDWLPDIHLNLQNSVFEGELRLRLHHPEGESPSPRQRISPTPLHFVSSNTSQHRLAALHKQVVRLAADDDRGGARAAGTYCYDYRAAGSATDRLLKVDFGSARVARLAWDLPTGDCRYQWLGSDFRYERWTGSEPEQEEWIYQLAAPQPSTIYHVAKQLRSEGRFDWSRDLFYEAKRISYEPRDEGSYQTCGWSWAFWSADSCVRQCILYWYLTASGFGVKPEFTVVGLTGTWAVGLVTYVLYSRYARPRDAAMQVLLPERRPLDLPVDRDTDRPGHETGSSPGGAAGLEEEATPLGPWRHAPERAGTEQNRPPPGFALHQEREPKRFSLPIFSLDATLPVINLHAYDSYYPEAFWAQLVSYAQHVIGWILVTSLIASLAVL